MLRRPMLALCLIFCLLWPAAAQPDSWEDAEKRHSPEEVTAMLTSLAFMSLKLGSYEATDQLIVQIEERIPRTGVPEGWDLLRGEVALAPLAKALGRGQFDTVVRDAPIAIERARKANRPERELSLILMLLEAARITGQPRILEQHLPRTLELARSLPGTTGRLALFVALSLDAQRRYRLKPPTAEALKADHDAAWASLNGLELDSDYYRNSVVEGRLTGPTALMWWERALAVGGAELAVPMILADLQQMQLSFLREQPDSEPVEFIRALNLQCLVGMLEAGLNAMELVSRLPAFSQQVLAQYRVIARQIDELYANVFKMEQDLRHQYPLLSNVSFLRGDLSMIRGRAHQLIARELINKLDPGQPIQVDEIDTELALTSEIYARTENSALQTDLNFERLRVLFATRQEGWMDEAGRLLARMVPALEKVGYRPALIAALTAQGRLLAEQGKSLEAIASLQRAVTLTEAYITEVGGGADTARRLRQESGELYDLLTRLQLEAGRGEEAADTFDRHRQLNSASQFRMQDLTPRSDSTRALVVRAMDAQTELEAVEKTRLAYASPGVARLADTKQDYYRVLQEIQDQDQAYAKLQVRPKTFSRVQKSLPEDTVLVQLFPSDEHLYLFVATRKDLKVRRVDVKSPHVTELVMQFRSRVSTYSRNADGQKPFQLADDPELALTLDTLSALILEPLAEDLQGKKVLAFVPTGTLSYFPFQALRRDGRYLIQSLEVVTLVKASDLDQLDQAVARPDQSLLALGDPDGTLAAARQEVKELEKLFPNSQVWIGPEATSERLKDVRVGYLHLATHGALNARDPLKSYLLMATSNGTNRLTVSEIAGLNLDGVQLVTLSACSSGLAEREPGVGLELASLADAFSYAGSPTLVASLWKVADQPTLELMLAFYAELRKGDSRGEALREAQVTLLEQPRYAHPFYWAPFTLMGDWR